jgi:hypothetical protein
MDAGRREGEAEGSQAQLGPCKIADANDEVIDSAGHGISGAANRTVTCGINAGQSIVTDVQLKKIYCKVTAY